MSRADEVIKASKFKKKRQRFQLIFAQKKNGFRLTESVL